MQTNFYQINCENIDNILMKDFYNYRKNNPNSKVFVFGKLKKFHLKVKNIIQNEIEFGVIMLDKISGINLKNEIQFHEN